MLPSKSSKKERKSSNGISGILYQAVTPDDSKRESESPCRTTTPDVWAITKEKPASKKCWRPPAVTTAASLERVERVEQVGQVEMAVAAVPTMLLWSSTPMA